MPGTIRSARLPCAENMHPSRLLAAFFQDLLHPVFFTKVFLAHVLDLQALGFCQRLRILSNAFSQRLGIFGVVEDAEFRVHTDNGSFLAHSTRAANCLRSQSDPSHSGPRPALHDSVPKATRSLWFVLDHGSTPFGYRVSNLNHLLLQYGRGKLPLGKPRAYPVSICLWQAYLVQLSLFCFGLSS